MRNKLVLCALLSAGIAGASILPPNDLHLRDDEVGLASKGPKMTEKRFNELIDSVFKHYTPIIKRHGVELKIERNWKNKLVNAFARQRKISGKTTWIVAMFGGLARRPEITEDGFALVVCHELGHHLAGYPFYRFFNTWAASEGQADYFATQVCARKVWEKDVKTNATFAKIADDTVKDECNGVWQSVNDQNLCYRIATAGQSLATLFAKMPRKPLPIPEFDTPDKKKVARTYYRHPKPQCRLDTYFQGALCDKTFEDDKIPGNFKEVSKRNSKDAEREAAKVSCHNTNLIAGVTTGLRPRCWFKPLLTK